MKSGASDPFADDGDDDDEEADATEADATEADATEADATEADESEADESGAAAAGESVTAAADVDEAAVEGSAGMDEGDEEAAEELAEDAVDDEIDRSDVPWVLRRDAVKDDRPHVHQLFVRDDTDGRARRAESRLEERLDMDVYRLDAREAIYLVGMDHLDEVAELLEEWGYNF